MYYSLGKAEWKIWADLFQELDEITPDGAEWGLKENAKQAYAKMVGLFPELFSGEK